MNNKSQALMEFIMTYGWAILSGIVAIGVLAYFGVFNYNSTVSPDCVAKTFCEERNLELLTRNFNTFYCTIQMDEGIEQVLEFKMDKQEVNYTDCIRE